MENEKKLYQKWWFWIVLLIIIFAIGIIIIVQEAFSFLKTTDLEKEVKEICKDATLYSSITSNTLFLELHNFETDYNMSQLVKINELIKTKIENGELIGYNKLITMSYINSNGKNEVLISRTEDDLNSFELKSELRYIDFEEYNNVCSKLNEVMDSYTGLFESTF